MQITNVKSTNIAAHAHQRDVLYLQFVKTGAVYSYDGVTESEYAALIGAESIGSHFHSRIRKNFPAVLLSSTEAAEAGFIGNSVSHGS